MKIKTNALSGVALDWAVAKAIGEYKPVAVPSYSTEWSQGGPIMEREKIELHWSPLWGQWGSTNKQNARLSFMGKTPLISAMRCFVASKLGGEVEIPEGLI